LENRMVFFKHFSQSQTRPSNVFLIATSQEFLRHSLTRKNKTNFFLTFHKLISLSDTSCYIKLARELIYYSLTAERNVEFPGISTIKELFKIDSILFVHDGSNRIYRVQKDGEVTRTSMREE